MLNTGWGRHGSGIKPLPASTGKLTSFSAQYERNIAHRAILEEREAERSRQLRFQEKIEKVKLHRARGMSERQLIAIYGDEVVKMEMESRVSAKKDITAPISSPSAPGVAVPLSSAQARIPLRRVG